MSTYHLLNKSIVLKKITFTLSIVIKILDYSRCYGLSKLIVLRSGAQVRCRVTCPLHPDCDILNIVDTASVDLNRRSNNNIVKKVTIKDGDSYFSFITTKTSSSSWQRILSTTGESNVPAAIQEIHKKLNAHKKTRSFLPSSIKSPSWLMMRIKENAQKKRFTQGNNSPSGNPITRTSSKLPKLRTSSKAASHEPKVSMKKATVLPNRPLKNSRMRKRRPQPWSISTSLSSRSSSGRTARNTTFSS